MDYKERLLEISNLNIAGTIEQMGDEQLNEYTQKLQTFIGDFSAQEEKIKAELTAKNYDNCRQSLLTIGDMLKKINADVLAEECLKQADNLKGSEPDKSVAYITNFLAAISALSIDVQVAIYKKDEQDAKEPEVAEGGSILAVDDVVFFLNQLKVFLKDTNCKLTCVPSGEVALRFIRGHRPDLFLLDIEMPGMNGYDLARKIRESGQKAPIVFLTGNAAKSYVVKAIEVGAADFIIKPINKEQLIEKIGKFIKLEKSCEDEN